jgi:ABC-2 type transport system ATP-binding protein
MHAQQYPPEEATLSASRLYKAFGSHQAVQDVSFQVRKGEIFGFLGPNGAGKTTTVRMLTGILVPDKGEVFIEGRNLHDDPLAAKMHIGVIPEVGTIYVDMTAQQNIELTGRFYGMGREEIRGRSREILTSLGMYERRNDLVKTFSKGMRQRISIACAIIHNPSLLFMDEPTEGLDVQSRRLIADTIRGMNKRGCTVFLTTHNIEEANALCDRVCIINKGAIVALDKPEALRRAFDKTQEVEAVLDSEIDLNRHGMPYALEVRQTDVRLRCITDNPDETIRTIVAISEKSGAKIISLETKGPSLEDAFIALTEAGR